MTAARGRFRFRLTSQQEASGRLRPLDRWSAPAQAGPEDDARALSAEQQRHRVLLAVTDEFCSILLRGQIPPLRATGADVAFAASPGTWCTDLAAENGVDHFPIPMRREISPPHD